MFDPNYANLILPRCIWLLNKDTGEKLMKLRSESSQLEKANPLCPDVSILGVGLVFNLFSENLLNSSLLNHFICIIKNSADLYLQVNFPDRSIFVMHGGSLEFRLMRWLWMGTGHQKDQPVTRGLGLWDRWYQPNFQKEKWDWRLIPIMWPMGQSTMPTQ